jgi:carbon monoxide dehydrogenase subunit G
MKIENSFMVDQPVEQAWETLLDVPLVARCMPGVTLMDANAADSYELIGKIGLGPVQLVMLGEIRIVQTDVAARTATLSGKGTDQKGRGTSTATVVFALHPQVDDPQKTQVAVVTNLELAGSIAQYGRGTGVIQAVAAQIVTQFAANLQMIVAEQPANGASRTADFHANGGMADKAPAPAMGAFGLLCRALWSLFRSQPSTRDGVKR